MGFLDALLGRRKVAGPAKSDRLFAMSTAYVTLDTSHDVHSRGVAAIVFQPLATADFTQIVKDMEDVVRSTGQETGTTIDTSHDVHSRGVAAIVFQQIASADFKQILEDSSALVQSAATDTGTKLEQSDDDFGYRWMIFRDDDFEDLVTAVNTVASELQAGGYGDRVLAAVFAWEDNGQPVDFIYNFKRGKFYPFAPKPGKTRDNEYELRLKAQIENDLPIEPELDRWFPLWDAPLG